MSIRTKDAFVGAFQINFVECFVTRAIRRKKGEGLVLIARADLRGSKKFLRSPLANPTRCSSKKGFRPGNECREFGASKPDDDASVALCLEAIL